jgi:hypothetical protein
MADLEENLRRIPLISPQRMVIAGALVLLAIALPAAAFFRPAGPVPADTEPDWQAGAIEYLSEIGFGVEYGSAAPVLHKWTQDVRIKVHGSPTEVDRQTIEQVVAELNSMVGEINLELVDEAANLDVYFSPEYQFSYIEPTYVPTNLGFFRVWFDGEGSIKQGRVLIASDGATQVERIHLIREELTQSLGLFKDSWEHSDSIFYEGWTTTDKYGPLDEATIRLLYQPQLEPGMNRSQVRSLFLPTD